MGERGLLGDLSNTAPVMRSAAVRVIRGAMSGSARVLSGDLALPVEAPTALLEGYVPWLSPV